MKVFIQNFALLLSLFVFSNVWGQTSYTSSPAVGTWISAPSYDKNCSTNYLILKFIIQ